MGIAMVPPFSTIWLYRAAEAEILLEKLRHLWEGTGGSVMQNPQAWIVETVESKSL